MDPFQKRFSNQLKVFRGSGRLVKVHPEVDGEQEVLVGQGPASSHQGNEGSDDRR